MEKETIGPKIKKFRQRRQLSQEALAKSLGYSGKSVISHIENGDADMTYEKILLLLREYELDANELFEVEKLDKKLEAHRFNLRKEKRVVVYIHGLHGSHEEAKDFNYFDKSYDVVGLEYEDKNPWELKEEIHEKFKKLTENYREIIVIANSIGAFYTYEYLSDFSISQAFFISPVASMSQLIFNIMMDNNISRGTLKEKGTIVCKDGTVLNYDFYNYLCNHKDSWNIPTNILYGSHDELVYIENIAEFLENHPLTKLTIMKGAGHFFHTDEEKQFIKDWLFRSVIVEE